MSLAAFAARIQNRYGNKLASLYGVRAPTAPWQVGFGKTPGALALTNADSGETTINRAYFQGTSKADRKGLLLHELAETYLNIPNGQKLGANLEGLIDVARDKLLPGANARAGWTSSKYTNALENKTPAQLRAYVARAGAPSSTGGNMTSDGPQVGNNQRKRNTITNAYSKTQGYDTALAPGQALQYGQAIAQTKYNLAQQLAQIQAQRGTIRGTYGMDVAAAKAAAVQGGVTAEGDALDRGILGSSVDVEARTQNLAARAQALQQALQARQTGMLGLQSARIDAQNQAAMGIFEILAQRAAAQQEAAIAQAAERAQNAIPNPQGGRRGSTIFAAPPVALPKPWPGYFPTMGQGPGGVGGVLKRF